MLDLDIHDRNHSIKRPSCVRLDKYFSSSAKFRIECFVNDEVSSSLKTRREKEVKTRAQQALMDTILSAAIRLLNEENSSLVHASIGKIISTGLLLGIVHVLKGPDHLSALAAMSNGGFWCTRTTLGQRTLYGLIIVAAIFFFCDRPDHRSRCDGRVPELRSGCLHDRAGPLDGKECVSEVPPEIDGRKTGAVIDEDVRSRSCTGAGGLNSGTRCSTPTHASSEEDTVGKCQCY